MIRFVQVRGVARVRRRRRRGRMCRVIGKQRGEFEDAAENAPPACRRQHFKTGDEIRR